MSPKFPNEPVVMDPSLIGTSKIETFIKKALRRIGSSQYKLFIDDIPYWVNRYNSERRGERILSNFLELSPDTIVEVGCSEGYITRILRNMYSNASLKALDINTEFTDKIAQIDGVEFMVGDGYFPSQHFPDSSIDLYLMMANFAYVAPSMNLETVRNILTGVTKVVSNNGHLVISDEFSFAAFRKEEGRLKMYKHDNIFWSKNYNKIFDVLNISV